MIMITRGNSNFVYEMGAKVKKPFPFSPKCLLNDYLNTNVGANPFPDLKKGKTAASLNMVIGYCKIPLTVFISQPRTLLRSSTLSFFSQNVFLG